MFIGGCDYLWVANRPPRLDNRLNSSLSSFIDAIPEREKRI